MQTQYTICHCNLNNRLRKQRNHADIAGTNSSWKVLTSECRVRLRRRDGATGRRQGTAVRWPLVYCKRSEIWHVMSRCRVGRAAV
jgi:hypothetical protein